MSKPGDTLAFDRASVRTVDVDGRMHVEITNISKAAVNPYRGAEIPDGEALGLDPDRIYFLLRDPEELERAAPTFNNIPLLSKHIPVTADEPQKEYVVGSTGTDAAFVAPYLKNSLVVWDAVAIAGIESREQQELSSAYRYRADMTPGVFQGVPYDGVMRDIRGNHVALVEVGRAGPDVVVGDSLNLSENPKMKHSKIAIAVAGALRAYLRPRLAQDAAMPNLGAVVKGVKVATLAMDKPRIVAALQAQTKGKLAQDADLADLAEVIDAFSGTDDEMTADDDLETDPDVAADDDVGAKLRTLLAGKLDDAEIEKICAAFSGGAAMDDPAPFEGKPKDPETVSKPAMDAALKVARAEATADAVSRMRAIRVAEKEVQPLIGEVAAMDSAADVYKLALDDADVDTTDVPPSAYRSMVQLLVKNATATKTPRVAMDADADKAFYERYPAALTIQRS